MNSIDFMPRAFGRTTLYRELAYERARGFFFMVVFFVSLATNVFLAVQLVKARHETRRMAALIGIEVMP